MIVATLIAAGCSGGPGNATGDGGASMTSTTTGSANVIGIYEREIQLSKNQPPTYERYVFGTGRGFVQEEQTLEKNRRLAKTTCFEIEPKGDGAMRVLLLGTAVVDGATRTYTSANGAVSELALELSADGTKLYAASPSGSAGKFEYVRTKTTVSDALFDDCKENL